MKVYLVFKWECFNMCDYVERFDSVYASKADAEKRVLEALKEVSKVDNETVYLVEEILK